MLILLTKPANSRRGNAVINDIHNMSKVHKKNMPRESAFKFYQWKIFFENYKPMRVWSWLVYKNFRNVLSLVAFCQAHSNSKKVSYLPWKNKYSYNLKTTCHIKPKLFLWMNFLKHLLLTKYITSAAATLKIVVHSWYPIVWQYHIQSPIKHLRRYFLK